MKKSVELKQERTAKVEAQQTIVDAARAEKRELNDQETTSFDVLTEEIRAFKTKIERAEQIEANELLLANRTAAPVDMGTSNGEGKEKGQIFERVSFVKAIREASPNHSKGLTGAEKEMHEIGMKENRDADVKDSQGLNPSLSIPLSYFSRATAQTVTEDSGNYGGKLVTNQAPKMVAPLRPKLALEGLGATFMTGLTGGNIPLLVDNDFAMSFMAETAAITPQKKTYDGPTLAPKRAGGAVDISNQLLMQSSVDVENRIKAGLSNGFSQLLHQAAIQGAGGTAPTGLLTYSGVNTAASAGAVVPTWDLLVELQALIEEDNATSENLGWVIHPKVKALLKTIKKDAGSGRFLLEENMIDGLPFVSTSQISAVDDGGIDCYPIFYGDFSQMVIGQWGSINVTINPYSADLSNSLRLVLNTYADMQIANPKAFARNQYFAATATT